MLAMLLAASLAAPVPKAKAPDLYYPTVEGTKRVLRTTTGDQITEATETVTKVVEKDGVFTVTSIDSASGGKEFTYTVSEKGIMGMSKPGSKSQEAITVLKLPAKEGDTWTQVLNELSKDASAINTFGKEEVVEVPAGKFQAITVNTEFVLDVKISIKTKKWYAVGVGPVKWVNTVNGTETVVELKEFTPGK